MNRLLIKAMEEQFPLEMIYISSTNKITQRKVLINEVKGSTFRAYCCLRKQTRLFKIDHILSIMPVKSSHNKIV